jgi:cell division GTPase FtsZ
MVKRPAKEIKYQEAKCKIKDRDPCLGEPGHRRSEADCRVIEDCLTETTDDFDFDAWLRPSTTPEHGARKLKSTSQNLGLCTYDLNESKGSTRYAWIGAGQCGGRLVKSFYDLGYKKVLAVNTTGRDLDLLDIPQSQKLLMEINQEEGSARDMEKASRAVQQHRQNILHLAGQTFGTQVDRIMVCFGAGGNAGSGSAVELIEIAKRYARSIGLKNPNKTVGVIMTLPTVGEATSPRAAQNTHNVAAALSRMAAAGEISPLVIVDNDKISKMYPGTTVQSFWADVNGTVASLFDIFNRLSSLSSPYTCFDPADYDGIMGSGGCLIMGAAKVDRLDDRLAISKAVEDSLRTTLFAGAEDLTKAKAGGCVVVGGNELMANIKGLQDNIDYAFDVLSEVTGQATIYRGIYEDNTDGLSVYTVIGGLDGLTARLKDVNVDLSHQSSPVDIEGPPLRERREDILPLAEHFLAKHAGLNGETDKTLSPDARTLILNYSWPGNVQELADAIRHACDATTGPQIQPDALPLEILFADTELYSQGASSALDKVKRKVISKAYDEFLQSLT